MKKLLITFSTLILLSGCLRGESKSLDEVLKIAQDQFHKTSQQDVPPEVANALKTIQSNLENAIKNSNAQNMIGSVGQVSEELTEILPKAGYTVRPALTELRNQFLELSGNSSLTTEEIKLLASRTYSTLAQELETNKFGIK